MTERVKFGYLSYDDMLSKIETGEVNEYDVIYSKDRLITYIISEDLTPIELRSRVYVFNNISEAEATLNSSTDTYIGQVVAILYKDKYRGYIVNYDNSANNGDGAFRVSPLWENPDTIDYNTLGNRPIINITGTLDNPILITTLTPGIYKVKGQYKIIDNEETIYLSASGDLFLIGTSDTGKLIKCFTKDTIYDYVISDDVVKKKIYITDEYLSKNGYVTTDYVDEKFTALEESIKSDVEEYVQKTIEDILTEKVDALIDERLDEKLDEKIQAIPSEKVMGLF
jgi:hypothetical protein